MFTQEELKILCAMVDRERQLMITMPEQLLMEAVGMVKDRTGAVLYSSKAEIVHDHTILLSKLVSMLVKAQQ